MNRDLSLVVCVLIVASALPDLESVRASHPATHCENKTLRHHYVGSFAKFAAINEDAVGGGQVVATDDNLDDCNGDAVPGDPDGDAESGTSGGRFPTAYLADAQGYAPYKPCQALGQWAPAPHHPSGPGALYHVLDEDVGSTPGRGVAWSAGADGRLPGDDGSVNDAFPTDPDHDGDNNPATGPNFAGDNCAGDGVITDTDPLDCGRGRLGYDAGQATTVGDPIPPYRPAGLAPNVATNPGSCTPVDGVVAVILLNGPVLWSDLFPLVPCATGAPGACPTGATSFQSSPSRGTIWG